MLGTIVIFIIIGLPVLAAFGYAAFRTWLKYRSEQALPPETFRELLRTVEALKKDNERLRKRVENLEVIVSSVEWEKILEEKALPPEPNEEEPLSRRQRTREE